MQRIPSHEIRKMKEDCEEYWDDQRCDSPSITGEVMLEYCERLITERKQLIRIINAAENMWLNCISNKSSEYVKAFWNRIKEWDDDYC